MSDSVGLYKKNAFEKSKGAMKKVEMCLGKCALVLNKLHEYSDPSLPLFRQPRDPVACKAVTVTPILKTENSLTT